MDKGIIIYQVLTRLWGEGKFSSWDEASFNYLHSLGIDYIWFTGIPRHASGKDFVKGNPGSPYAITDWYDVNPYLADKTRSRMKEFEALVDRTHKAGLSCLIDFIPNHVACDYAGRLAVHDWCDGDWTDTRKVDWSALETREEFVRVLSFWASKGVDGFRCDMVELVPSDALGEVIARVRKDFPNLLFVAEVYGRENYGRYLDEAGFDLLYDKSGSYDILRGILNGSRSARELTWNWQWLGQRQGSMLNFLENHDEQRLASPFFASNTGRARAALAYSMLFNGASFMIYAGQELGEDAAEGSDGRTSIFNWCQPLSLRHIWTLIHEGKGLGRKERSTLSEYRQLCALKKRISPDRNWDLCYCNENAPGFNPDTMTAFMRFDGHKALLVFCNFSDREATVLLRFPKELRESAGITAEAVQVTAEPWGYALLKCN
ncbi:MAG: hypothetical protein K6E37_02085 [Bacteroidales bacterium]|nr:hypothetical protein [Bacteroidales bacterium]